MQFDYSKLKGLIVEKYGSMSGFANEIGVAVQTISAKLSNKMTVTKNDIVLWSEKLDISLGEIGIIFFKQKV